MTNYEINRLYALASMAADKSRLLKKYGRADFMQECAMQAVTYWHKREIFDGFDGFAKSIIWFTSKKVKTNACKNLYVTDKAGNSTKQFYEVGIDYIKDTDIAGANVQDETNKMAGRITKKEVLSRLTKAEQTLVGLIYEGRTYADIGRALKIAPNNARRRVIKVVEMLGKIYL